MLTGQMDRHSFTVIMNEHMRFPRHPSDRSPSSAEEVSTRHENNAERMCVCAHRRRPCHRPSSSAATSPLLPRPMAMDPYHSVCTEETFSLPFGLACRAWVRVPAPCSMCLWPPAGASILQLSSPFLVFTG